MALELNTDPVDIKNFEAFNKKLVKQLSNLRDMVNEGRTDKINLSIKPVQDFGKELIEEAPEEAKELGCDPDYNAYTLEPNPRPDGEAVTFRTGAGHIHIGWGADIPVDNKDHMEICAGFVKALDCTVGLFMTVIDQEPRRRVLYGKAGAFRPKSYGVEYRTPSNVWIKNRDFRYIVHSLVNKAIHNHSRGYGAEHLFYPSISQEEVRRIIDEGDAKKAFTCMENLMSYDGTWGKLRDTILGEAQAFAAKNAA